MDRRPRLIQLDDYKRDREYSSNFEPLILNIVKKIPLRPKTVRLATEREDTKQATDAVCVGPAVAIRVRRPEYAHHRDVTVRSWRKSETRTELAKIFEDGWCDLYFYGWAANDTELERWLVLDLDAVRTVYRSKRTILGEEKRNLDGTTGFRPLLVDALPNECVVASGRRWAWGPLTKKTQCGIRARYGRWEPSFLKMIGGEENIPRDYHEEVERLRAGSLWDC